jgi:hypothetical protein
MKTVPDDKKTRLRFGVRNAAIPDLKNRLAAGAPSGRGYTYRGYNRC